jgi:acyl carrier protein
VGAPGHCAYAAANSWLDAFTNWRRVQGLPATSIAWSAWAGIGLATAAAVETTITPEEGAYAFEALLRHDRAYTGYAPLATTPWLTALAQRSKFGELFQAKDESSTDTSRFLAELHELPKEEWLTRLRRLVSDKLSKILRRAIDPDRPLSEYGLDSLANLELRNYLMEETAIRITPSHISTVNDLAGALYEYLTVDGTRGGLEPYVPGQITRLKSPAEPEVGHR